MMPELDLFTDTDKEIKPDAFSNPTPAADPTNLPPAGGARREELKRRTDQLEEKAEEQYADVGKIPKEALKPDREIREHIRKSHLEVGTQHPYLKVKWVNYVNLQGSMVWAAKADGWAVATAQDIPDAKELVREDGTIRIGDVLLMCIRIDDYLVLEKHEKTKRLRQQYGVEAEIHDLAARTNAREGKVVFKNVQTPGLGGMSEETLQTIEARAERQTAARRTAAEHLGNRMKRGTLPGVPIR
jgi:hypothetical protein